MNRENKRNTGIRVRPNSLASSFPKFEKPNPIGFFSVTTEREYDPTATQLRYLKLPHQDNFPLNLNTGLEIAIKKPGIDERLDMLLKYIYDNAKRLLKPGSKSPEFICYRGILRKIMCTPYEKRNDWCILATHFNGSIYLCQTATERELNELANTTERQKTMSAWGFKFEQYCAAESPHLEPDTSAPVNECAEFNCVFTTKLNGIELLYGAEMDCIVTDEEVQIDEKPELLRNLHFVELKTCQNLQTSRQRHTFEHFKTINWWCQSFLVGIEDIYTGMRNENGFVQTIEQFKVRSLPKIAANSWQPNVCANFLITFLTTVKRIMADINNPYATCAFYYDPHASQITYELSTDVTEFSFLPGWYVQLIEKQNQQEQKI